MKGIVGKPRVLKLKKSEIKIWLYNLINMRHGEKSLSSDKPQFS